MSHYILFLSLLALVSCSYNVTNNDLNTKKDSAIMGGTIVDESDSIYSGVVAIYNQYENSFCTGSLIGGNYILTAAHCVHGKPSKMKIIFGLDIDAIMSSHEPDIVHDFTRTVVSYLAHPSYNIKQRQNVDIDLGDIAVIKFSGSIPPGYKPVQILEDDSKLKRGTMVTVAGFGVSKIDSEPVDANSMPDIKQAIEYGEVLCDDNDSQTNCVKIEMDGDGILRRANAPISSIQESEFRLDESKGHGTCSGDSGGPAYLEVNSHYYLLGVTSRGSFLCDDVGVYTNAVYYKKWISETINKL